MATAQATLGAISDDATWRAYAQFIHDILDAAGFVQTADTGQIDIPTANRPGTANTAAGYEVWRFDDTLQGTYPIFFKLEYGIATNNSRFGMWITIGKGSDGSGTITGELLARMANLSQGQSSAANTVSVASGVGGKWINVFCSAYLGTTFLYSPAWFGFSLERSKNADGDDTGDGVIFYGIGYSTGARTGYIRYSDGASWFDEFGGAQLPYSQTNGAGPGAQTAVYPNYIFSSGRVEFPGKNLAAGFTANFACFSDYTIKLYGNDVVMRGFPNATSDTLQLVFRKHSVMTHGTHTILMRWE